MKNKKTILGISAVAVLGCVLAACQSMPINASTTITNKDGAGSKTINALMLVDGSCQIEPDVTSFPSNTTYYYIDDVNFDNPQFTPKADGAKVGMIKEGYFRNPNKIATSQGIWDEFNKVVENNVPEGFEFKIKTVQSNDWKDSYMDEIPGADVSAWKGYVYSLTYTWNNVEEYISKTKTLIGDSYGISDLADAEDGGQKWASFEISDEATNTYTWKEAYLVNYWSVYDICDRVMNSEYFNRAALGEEYKVNTENAFSVAMQQYKIGESDVKTIKIDNSNGLNEDLSLKYIEASGVIKKEEVVVPPSTTNVGLIVGIAVGAVVVIAAGVGTYIVLKNKKAKK